MNWFYSPDGIQRLEVGDEALAAMIRDGRLTGDMLLWREGQDGWRPAREVRADLFAVESVPPVASPEPEPTGPPMVAPVTPPAPSPYYQTPPMQRPANAGALTSVISGGVGVVIAATGFCCCLSGILSTVAGLVAVVFGHQAYSAAKFHPQAENDKTLAIIGLILGYLTLATSLGAMLYNLLVVGIAGMGVMAEGLKNGSFNF